MKDNNNQNKLNLKEKNKNNKENIFKQLIPCCDSSGNYKYFCVSCKLGCRKFCHKMQGTEFKLFFRNAVNVVYNKCTTCCLC